MSVAYQAILDQVARVVGGSQPDPSGNIWWFSGKQTGDGTGIAGLEGCYSVPPDSIETVPVGVVIAHEFETTHYMSHKADVDRVRLQILVRTNDTRTQIANLNPYRDSVPAAFEQHMQLNASANVWQVLVKSGKTGVFSWGAQNYLGWEFDLTIYRDASVTYVV